jgi:hypothetical protein
MGSGGKQGVAAVLKASDDLLNSKKLPQLLDMILEIGNFLNEGSDRGGAFGFTLSFLNKVIIFFDRSFYILRFFFRSWAT